MRMKLLAVIFSGVLIAAAPSAGPDRTGLVTDFLNAYNAANSAALRAFDQTHASAQSLKDEPPDAFAARLLRVRDATGALTLARADGIIGPRVSFLTQSAAHHWYELQLMFDAAGQKLDGVDLQETLTPPQDIAAPHGHAQVERAVRRYVEQLARTGEFAGVVHWESPGYPAFEQAVGLADRERRIPIGIVTRFNIASIGKIFTHIAVLQLAQAGKLKLTDTVGMWLPDYPNAEVRKKVTVEELLDMRSGIGDFFGPKFAQGDPSRIRSLQDYLPLFADQPLAFEPGTAQMYSNGGYIVLGLIIEKAWGQSYYDYVRTHIFEPAHMTRTGYPTIDERSAERAIGYVRTPGGMKNAQSMQPGRGSSAGGAYSTIGDLASLARALRANVLLTAQDRHRLPARGESLGIAGGSPGSNAVLFTDLDTGSVLIVLSNLDPPAAEALARQIRRWSAES